MEIIIKNISGEAHHSIDIIKSYYGPLQRVYSIITIKILSIMLELAFQMTFKAMNDLVGSNRLVFILLVFGTYCRIYELNTPSASIIQCVIAMKKTMNEVRKCPVSRQVNDAQNTRNEPSTATVYSLPTYLLILVYWKGNVS